MGGKGLMHPISDHPFNPQILPYVSEVSPPVLVSGPLVHSLGCPRLRVASVAFMLFRVQLCVTACVAGSRPTRVPGQESNRVVQARPF